MIDTITHPLPQLVDAPMELYIQSMHGAIYIYIYILFNVLHYVPKINHLMTSTATASPDHCNRILYLVPLPALDEVRHKFLAAYSPKGALKLAEGQGMQYKLSPLTCSGRGGGGGLHYTIDSPE